MCKKDERKVAPEYWIYAVTRAEQYMPEGRGLLAFHTNAGVTFDLEAMRQLHRRVRPARFRAVAGVADARSVVPSFENGFADVWVFVDGQLKWKRTGLRPEDGPVKINVELRAGDRFLTLVGTDRGQENAGWLVLGDPVLQMAAADEGKEVRPMNGP